MPPKFGTSGVRGLVTELTEALCIRYARAFLATTPHEGLVLLGGDLRPSTPAIMTAVARGAASLELAAFVRAKGGAVVLRAPQSVQI